MLESVSEKARKVALTARLLVFAVAFLFGAAPDAIRRLASDGCATGVAQSLGDGKQTGAPSAGQANGPDTCAVAPNAPADGDGGESGIASRPQADLGGHKQAQAGYLLPPGDLLATAFAPRGPPPA